MIIIHINAIFYNLDSFYTVCLFISNKMSFTINVFALTVVSKATNIHTVCVKNFS